MSQQKFPDTLNLELIMQDVLEGMEELSLQLGYQSSVDPRQISRLTEMNGHNANNIIHFTRPPLRHTA
jgi:hypothetical protein